MAKKKATKPLKKAKALEHAKPLMVTTKGGGSILNS
jgi:hypothetical protein